MNKTTIWILNLLVFFAITGWSGCAIMEKASTHGFERGIYTMKDESRITQKVYIEKDETLIKVYTKWDKGVKSEPILFIPLGVQDSFFYFPISFSKQSLDIDITSVLFKVRSKNAAIPLQLTSDFNAALYTGWRYDNYRISGQGTPLGTCAYRVINRGGDFGVFAGLGATPIYPDVTNNQVNREYSGMIFQGGLAAFLESNVASFGVAFGYDYLLSPDRSFWIYRRKAWVGFVIGVALN